jgi:hypothetical protein
MTAEADGRVTVLFIAGLGRSGSTLLARLLGEVEGLSSVGELRYLLERGLMGGDLCGCGRPVPDCDVWAAVAAEAGIPSDGAARARLLAQERATVRLRQAWRLPADRRRGYPWLRAHGGAWLDHLLAVQRATARVTGGVVVDSSKLPSYGAALEATGGIDLRVIHLVRDPRGVAYSWSSSRARSDREGVTEMDRRDPLSAALLWNGWNAVARRLWSGSPGYSVMTYEALVADPAGAVRTALDEVGLADLGSVDLVDMVDGRAASLAASHSVAGNPGRMQAGTIQIAADDRWRDGFAPRHRIAVEALTRHSRRRYYDR